MLNEKFFENLKDKIRPYFKEGGAHEFSHTERVYRMAVLISKSENADIEVVKAAALLHDIARAKEEDGEIKCHAEEGAIMAKKILTDSEFPKEKIGKVVHAISVHRYKERQKAETKEAEIIQDADRLDALGAICIARAFSYGGKKGRNLYNPEIPPQKIYNSDAKTSINHFYEKILKIKPETFNTKKAKEIAKERYAFVKDFVERFIKEWNGEN